MCWVLVYLIMTAVAFGQLGCDRASNERPFTQPQSKPDGLFRIVQNNKHGYIDRTGKIVIPPQFDDAGPFSEGLADVKIGEKWGYVDGTGKVVISPQFDDSLKETFPQGEPVGQKDREAFLKRREEIMVLLNEEAPFRRSLEGDSGETVEKH